MESTQTAGLILIVDDQPQNLQVLRAILKKEGYQVAAANNGTSVFGALQKRLPDLILLDIMMPDVDGFEVCRQIKQDPRTQDIPVIFLTAMTETGDLLKGFEAGGLDYVTKPFNTAELLARVKTHVELQQARQALSRYAANMAALNQDKTEFLSIAAHDLKNPLSIILGMTEVMESNDEFAESEEFLNYSAFVKRNSERMLAIINKLLDINRIESGRLQISPQTFELVRFIADQVRDYRRALGEKELELDLRLTDGQAEIVTDPHLLHQVLDNLISNAIKYSPYNRRIELSLAQPDEQHYELEIRDQGPGFTEQDKSKLFQKFARLSARPTAGEHSTGLGLSIVKQLVDLLQGEISLESQPGQGSVFKLQLPRAWGAKA